MPFTVNKLDGEPIIIVEIRDPYDYQTDPPRMFHEIDQIASTFDDGGFVIYDCRTLDVSFNDLVAGMSAQVQGVPGSISDPRLTACLVGSSVMLRLAAEGFAKPQYGEIQVPLYDTLDDALNDLRSDRSSIA